MSDDEVLSLLDERIKRLEGRICGIEAEIDPTSPKPVVSSLQEIYTVLFSKTCGRERLNAFLNKIKFLEDLLNPMYEETVSQSAIKEEVILQDEQRVRKFLDNVNKLDNFIELVKKEPFLEILGLNDRINSLSVATSKNYDIVKKQAEIVNALTKEYSDTMMRFTEFFAKLDAAVTDLEVKAASKKVQDD